MDTVKIDINCTWRLKTNSLHDAASQKVLNSTPFSPQYIHRYSDTSRESPTVNHLFCCLGAMCGLNCGLSILISHNSYDVSATLFFQYLKSQVEIHPSSKNSNSCANHSVSHVLSCVYKLRCAIKFLHTARPFCYKNNSLVFQPNTSL